MPETPFGNETPEIKCPVCEAPMRRADKTNLFLCYVRRKAYPKGFSIPVPYYDCAMEFDKEGNIIYSQYEFPPYKVIIINRGSQEGTRVSKVKRIDCAEHFGMEGDASVIWEEVFVTDSILALPVQNFAECVEKLNLLTTFS